MKNDEKKLEREQKTAYNQIMTPSGCRTCWSFLAHRS